jgi:cephalosporin-C deacetylase
MNPATSPGQEIAAFWEEALAELRRVALEPELAPAPQRSAREYMAQQVTLLGLGGVRLRGWYCTPNGSPPPGGFPAVLSVPGYSGERPIPTQLPMHGYAVLLLYPRAQGESKAEWDLETGTKLTYHLTDRERYYYRGAYLDCVRGLDFLASRPEVNGARLGMWGRSQGGWPDPGHGRARPAPAGGRRGGAVPLQLPGRGGGDDQPLPRAAGLLAAHPAERAAALQTLAYFDPLNLVDAITCATLVNVGLEDQTCPARTILPVFEAIRTPGVPKALLVYPELRHEPCADFNRHALHWLDTYL